MSLVFRAGQDAPANPRPILPLMVFEPASRPKWEYRVITVDPREEEPLTEARLAEVGTEGWLLAAVVDLTSQPHGRLHYYFVRAAE
jgi:hypothetical protein